LRGGLDGVQEFEGHRLEKEMSLIVRHPGGGVQEDLVSLEGLINRGQHLHLRDIIVEAHESDHEVTAVLKVAVLRASKHFNVISVDWAGLDDVISDIVNRSRCLVHINGFIPKGAVLVESTLYFEEASHGRG